MSFQVEQIDHVELCVPDRHQAAAWYDRVLGLKVIEEFRFWAADPKGPLMIGTPCGQTKLALFLGNPKGSQLNIGFHLVAFRTNGKNFAEFISRLPELNLEDRNGQIVTKDSVRDHQRAYSIYFCDPYGHELELTCYDLEDMGQD